MHIWNEVQMLYFCLMIFSYFFFTLFFCSIIWNMKIACWGHITIMIFATLGTHCKLILTSCLLFEACTECRLLNSATCFLFHQNRMKDDRDISQGHWLDIYRFFTHIIGWLLPTHPPTYFNISFVYSFL